MVSTLRISRQQLAAFLKNDHDAIRQFETLFNTVANPDTTATATEPEIQIETAAHEALARIERLERAFQMMELGPALELASKENALGNPPSDGMVISSDTSGTRNWVSNGSIVKLEEVTLTSAASSVNFSDISQNYNHLKLQALARGSVASTGVDVCLRFNGDSSSNYDRTYLYSNNTHGNGYEYAQINGIIGYISADSSESNYAGFVDAVIPFYSKTNFNKVARGLSSVSTTTTSKVNQVFQSVQWRSTSAITSILVYPLSGSFKAGSTFVLYGEK